eukprot:COSAG02_NODE_16666_length_1065_cov_37.078179_1_plen_41_part_10
MSRRLAGDKRLGPVVEAAMLSSDGAGRRGGVVVRFGGARAG